MNNNICLKIGVAETDITPEKGIHLGGDAARYRPLIKYSILYTAAP
jgi:hypothetical protein